MCPAYDDVELLDWIRWAEKHGTNFLRMFANFSGTRFTQLRLPRRNPFGPRLRVDCRLSRPARLARPPYSGEGNSDATED
jgi:hypothetical protein